MKKVVTVIKLQIPAGKANPAPPVGPALGQHGLNIAEFCQKFNEESKGQEGYVLPTEITVYEDRTYAFRLKKPLTVDLIKKAINLDKGSGNPLKDKVGEISKAKIKEIAKLKMPDLNTEDVEQAVKIIEGTARQMGVKVKD
jgi:large subunit ribosomal protein L11